MEFLNFHVCLRSFRGGHLPLVTQPEGLSWREGLSVRGPYDAHVFMYHLCGAPATGSETVRRERRRVVLSTDDIDNDEDDEDDGVASPCLAAAPTTNGFCLLCWNTIPLAYLKGSRSSICNKPLRRRCLRDAYQGKGTFRNNFRMLRALTSGR